MRIMDTLIERASRKGVARIKNYEGGYGCEKYRVENSGDTWKLYHYETLTCTVEKGRVTYIYGESVSDRDSIEDFAYKLSSDHLDLHYYPSTGKFVNIVDNEPILISQY